MSLLVRQCDCHSSATHCCSFLTTVAVVTASVSTAPHPYITADGTAISLRWAISCMHFILSKQSTICCVDVLTYIYREVVVKCANDNNKGSTAELTDCTYGWVLWYFCYQCGCRTSTFISIITFSRFATFGYALTFFFFDLVLFTIA